MPYKHTQPGVTIQAVIGAVAVLLLVIMWVLLCQSIRSYL